MRQIAQMQELPLFLYLLLFIIFSEYKNTNHIVPDLKGDPLMSDKYIQEIIELLQKCDDIPLLDFIFHLLQKHLAQA
jgi:hypothetical protein